jgi:prolyl 4-hydroxylase
MAEAAKPVRRRLKKHDRVEIIGQMGFDLYVVQNFMTPEECAELCALIDANSRPSTLYAGTEVNGFRTSYSCDLEPVHPLILKVEGRICTLMGLDHRYGETVQGQRYEVGQQFKPHHDFFHSSEDYWENERQMGGQRTWTAMIYLNEPESGGETNFTKAGLCIQPRTAMLVIWNNMDEMGAPNDIAIHEGCPVTGGSKYIVTKWFRERFWCGHLSR